MTFAAIAALPDRRLILRDHQDFRRSRYSSALGHAHLPDRAHRLVSGQAQLRYFDAGEGVGHGRRCGSEAADQLTKSTRMRRSQEGRHRLCRRPRSCASTSASPVLSMSPVRRRAHRLRQGTDGSALADHDHDRRLAALGRLVRLRRQLDLEVTGGAALAMTNC